MAGKFSTKTWSGMEQNKPEVKVQKDWELNHIGFVVRDPNQLTCYYRRIGIGAIGPEQWVQTPDGGRVKTCFVRIGSLEIEFLQPNRCRIRSWVILKA